MSEWVANISSIRWSKASNCTPSIYIAVENQRRLQQQTPLWRLTRLFNKSLLFRGKMKFRCDLSQPNKWILTINEPIRNASSLKHIWLFTSRGLILPGLSDLLCQIANIVTRRTLLVKTLLMATIVVLAMMKSPKEHCDLFTIIMNEQVHHHSWEDNNDDDQ